jgi:hypothetical protein
MGHLIDQPDSLLQRVIQCAQRAIAIAVVGCAALALWAGPASAADPSPSVAGTGEAQTPAPQVDAPAAAEQATDPVQTAAPAPADAAPPAPVAAQAPDLPSVAAPVPAAPAVRTAASNVEGTVTTGLAGPTSKAPAPVHHGLPAGDGVKQTLTGAVDSADVSGAAASVPALGGTSSAASESAAEPTGRELRRGGMTPPRSPAGSAVSISVKQLITEGIDRFASAFGLHAPAGVANAGASASASGASTSSGLPGLPGPLQVPVLGSSGSPTTSSSSFFFFGFAGLLVGLWAAFAPALSRRLQGSPASWRPAPYLSLLELPG